MMWVHRRRLQERYGVRLMLVCNGGLAGIVVSGPDFLYSPRVSYNARVPVVIL